MSKAKSHPIERKLLRPLLFFVAVEGLLLLRLFLHHSFTGIRFVYNFTTILAPLIFLGSALWGFREWRRGRSKLIFSIAVSYLVIAALLVGLRIYASFFEAEKLFVRRVEIVSPKVTKPLTILHITDVQSSAVGRYERKAFKKIAALNADLILHTGDLIQPLKPATYESETPKLTELFERLTPPLGVFGVYGDVDPPLLVTHKESFGGMKILHDAMLKIEHGDDTVQLMGLTLGTSQDPFAAESVMQDLIIGSDTNSLMIVMGHSPDYAVAAQDLPLDLCLAGHTHGGQVRLPVLGPIVTLTRHIPMNWSRGFRDINRTRLNVSAGIGSEHAGRLPPIRINCPSEMTLIKIVPR